MNDQYGEGYGSYGDFFTTPSISFQTFSPNPVGASNATTGLIAGATDSTLSEPEGSTSSVYTVGVVYQGGPPLATPEVSGLFEPSERESHAMRGWAGEERGPREMDGRDHARGEARAQWSYYAGPEHTANLADVAKGSVKPTHKYGNDDVTRQNDTNGSVRYDGKTEKIQ